MARPNLGASVSHNVVKLSSNRWISLTSARTGRAREMIITTGNVRAETMRLSATGQFGRRKARRVSGFTRHGTGPTFGQFSFRKRRYEESERPRPRDAPTLRS